VGLKQPAKIQQCVSWHKTEKSKTGDGDDGRNSLQAIAAAQHAVGGPAKRRCHEQQVALPDFAAI